MLMHYGCDVDSILLNLVENREWKARDKPLSNVGSFYGTGVWELANAPHRVFYCFKEPQAETVVSFPHRNAQTQSSLRMLPDGRRSSSFQSLARITECLIGINALNLAGAKLLQSSFSFRQPKSLNAGFNLIIETGSELLGKSNAILQWEFHRIRNNFVVRSSHFRYLVFKLLRKNSRR